jgi:hypothetical protein
VKDADLVLPDEPLANLDYKLREGLRDELPRLFADRDWSCTPTTEPAETLLLGGLHGDAARGRDHAVRPDTDVSPPGISPPRSVFDPPINTAPVVSAVRGSKSATSRLNVSGDNWPGWPTARTRSGFGHTSCRAGENGCECGRGRRPDSRWRTGQRASVGRRDQRIESVVHFDLHGLGWCAVARRTDSPSARCG